MSDAAPQWQMNLFAIIAHPTRPQILLLQGEAGWSLPCVRLNERIWTPQVEKVIPVLQQTFAIDCTILRCATSTVDREAHKADAIYVVELRGAATLPAAGQWIGREALADLALAVPEQRAVLMAYLDELADGTTPQLRPAWARPGWFAAAEAWMQTELARHGYTLRAPIEQIKSCGFSCVLRGRTTTDDVYFKVASRLPLFSAEPLVMEALAVHHPAYIPAPLSIEREQGWMLLADVGPDLRQSPDLSAWETALRLHAQIQQSFVGCDETLFAMGCLDRRLERLASQLDQLFNDPAALDRLSPEEQTQIHALTPRLPQLCAELASCEIPSTLAHGDLHAGNIALRDGRYLFFDWTDSCVAHPFFDLVTMLQDAAESLDGTASRQLRDAYLSQWTEYAPMDRLAEIWALAKPLAALHQAVSYDYIGKSLEPASKHEIGGALPFWIREALRSYPV